MAIDVHPPKIFRMLLGKCEFKIKTNEKKIFLTFDDGPIPELTPWILETLEKYNAKATFFCVGENAKRHNHIFQQIIANGHSIGNHTYNHLQGLKTDNKQFIENIKQFNEVYASKLFRPPHGLLKPSQIRLLHRNYKIILWDVLSKDYDKKITPEQCFHNVIKYSVNGSIIVFHDNIKATENIKYALPKTLEYFAANGFTFDKINY